MHSQSELPNVVFDSWDSVGGCWPTQGRYKLEISGAGVGSELWETIVVPVPVNQVVEAFLDGQDPSTGKKVMFP